MQVLLLYLQYRKIPKLPKHPGMDCGRETVSDKSNCKESKISIINVKLKQVQFLGRSYLKQSQYELSFLVKNHFLNFGFSAHAPN